jgi:hypothetical protein
MRSYWVRSFDIKLPLVTGRPEWRAPWLRTTRTELSPYVWPEWESPFVRPEREADRPPLAVEIYPVHSMAKLTIRKAAGAIAIYFKREFGYDFPQYESGEHTGRRDRILLLVRESVAIGVICFRWREWDDAPHGLALAWVWLHPYCRAQGVLSGLWPRFRALYGDFMCEPPLSSAMRMFLAGRGECWEHGRDRARCALSREH